jgi:hypothetical protein
MREARKRKLCPMVKGDPVKTKGKDQFTPPPFDLPARKTEPLPDELRASVRKKLVRWAQHHCR